MNHSTLLSEPFTMDCPVATDGDYNSTQMTGYSNDEVENIPRDGGLSSRPGADRVQWLAPQSGMQDLHYSSSTALAMTPPDSCSDSFSPASGPLFPHVPFDRLTNPPRVPSLQPPTGMSANMHKPVHPMVTLQAFMNQRNAHYSSYALQRGMSLPLSGINDVSREHGYSNTPRALDALDRNHTTLLQQPPVESPQRPHAQAEAPPFEETSVLESIVADFGGTQQTIKPEVHAKIGRGFFPSDNKWTCYRRNYFAVTCSFSLHPWPSNVPLYIRHADGTLEPIRGFAMSISAIVNGQYGETRELVQHTPKRDKQSERPPPRVVLQPSPPQSLTSSSAGNGTHGFPLGSQSLDYNSSFAGTPQPPQSHMFERIQFQKATANNGKRRAQQQFYNLVVELQAEVAGPVSGESQWVLIARRHSDSMVVRGRSPGHYKDGRRDSTASMGPEGGSGDGSGSTLPHVMGQAARSHLLLYDSPHRGSLPYGRTDYRQMSTAEHSPLSDSPPLVSSSSSSGFEYSIGMNDTMDPMDTMKTVPTLDPYQDGFAGVTSNHRTSTGGFDPVYSTYNGYSTIHNSRSLCT